jgi:hypothetical protein
LAAVAAITVACSAPAPVPAPAPSQSPLQARYINGIRYNPAPWTTREYFTEAGRLRLAAGWSWPAHPVQSIREGQPVFYQTGFGTQAADSYWYCSWAATALNDSHLKSNERAAVAQLQHIRQLYYFTHSLDRNGRVLLSHELVTAERGDLKLLQNDVTLNCPHR